MGTVFMRDKKFLVLRFAIVEIPETAEILQRSTEKTIHKIKARNFLFRSSLVLFRPEPPTAEFEKILLWFLIFL